MMRVAVLAIAAVMVVVPARADQVGGDADAVASCIETAWPRDARALCTGIVADACQNGVADPSAEDIARCLVREADAWDAVMERQLPRLQRRASEVDAANGTADTLDSATATLESAQHAWRLYRDSECRHAFASWGGGGFSPVAHAACRLDLTARRVADFHARLASGG